MKKIIIALLIITVGFWLYSETGPIKTAISKRQLLNHPIISKLDAECVFKAATSGIQTSSSHLECITHTRYSDNDAKKETERLTILFSQLNNNPNVSFSAQSYYWQPGAKDTFPVLVYIGRDW